MKDGFVQLNFRLTRFPSWDKKLAFQAYAQDVVLADTKVSDDELEKAVPRTVSVNLRVLYGSVAMWYRVMFDVMDVVQDWMHLRVMLDINGLGIDEAKPVSLYIGEPTDMATGIVRFKEPHGPCKNPETFDVEEAGIWMLEVRRSA